MAKNSRRSTTSRGAARRPSSNPLRSIDARPIAEALEPRQLLSVASNSFAINEFGGPPAPIGPGAIAQGPDGRLWFTESGGTSGAIGRISTSGAINQFSAGLSTGAAPAGITAGPDGNLWFTEPGLDKIGRITTAGVITEFPLPTNGSSPYQITTGPDGNLWFTEQGNANTPGGVGRITTAGTVSEFKAGLRPGAVPNSIATGPDGALYLTEDFRGGGGAIGRIVPPSASNPSPTIGEFSIDATPSGKPSSPRGITAGPDGRIWFADQGGKDIGAITPGPVPFSSFIQASLGPNGDAVGIAPGPDGALWFTEGVGNQIGRITTGGNITTVPIPTAGAGSLGIVAGPDKNLWFTEQAVNQIGQVVLPQTSVTITSPDALIPRGTARPARVATFTELSPAATAANFQAAIDYGDGTTSTGVVTVDPLGGFDVTDSKGPHAFNSLGSYRGTVTVSNPAGFATSTFTTNVVALTASGVPVAATQGQPFTGAVATFTDSFGPRPAGSYLASIAWGDGTTSSGTVAASANGASFVVTGTHTYTTLPANGSFTVATTITVNATPSYSATATAPAFVAAAAPTITATGSSLTPTQNQPFTGQVAGFIDTVMTRQAGDYTVTINWGDGTTPTAGSLFHLSSTTGNSFAVFGTHDYTAAGTFTITTTITVTALPSDHATATGTATVSPIITLTPIDVYTTLNQPFTQPVATFPEYGTNVPESPGPSPSDFTAAIDWGDGTPPTPSTIVARFISNSLPATTLEAFDVTGSHTYTRLGSFNITTTVKPVNSPVPSSAKSTALVEVAGPINEVGRGISSSPESIAAGSDGSLWFTEQQPSTRGPSTIGRVTTGGAVKEFPGPIGQASSITPGPDGALWFVDGGGVGRITTAGVVSHFATGLPQGYSLQGIVAGPDGNLWFTNSQLLAGARAIGRITPQGTITEFSLSSNLSPGAITSGPDGNLWFTENGGDGTNEIGRITTAGVISQFPLPTPAGVLNSITGGPDGNVWFTEDSTGKIGRITPSGFVTEFTAGLSAASRPEGITTGPDGNLWFADSVANHVDRITPAGVITNFAVPTTGSRPQGIVTGPDRNLWFTEPGAAGPGTAGNQPLPGPVLTQIGQLVTPQSVVPSPVAVTFRPGVPFTGTFGSFADLSSLVNLPRFFTPTIDFGDGTTGTGTLTMLPNGSAIVTATHTYASAGTFQGSVVLADAVGVTAPSAFTATAPSFVVTNTNDSGPGSLRQAILNADRTSGVAITFAIPGPGAVKTIPLASPLPAITSPGILIDGNSQAAFEGVAYASPLVEIDGRGLAGTPAGLYFDANSGGSLIRGLSVFGFRGPLIDLESADVVQGNYLGLRADGRQAVAFASPSYTADGVLVHGAGALIGGIGPQLGNVISGNAGQGVDLVGPRTTSTAIFGNIIGLDPTGEARRGNGFNGITVFNVTGPETIGPGNLISANGTQGIAVVASQGVTIVGNSIGTDARGARAIGNAFDGILVDGQSSGIAIGGTAPGASNVISGNGVAGVVIQGGSHDNRISSDLIGTDPRGEAPIGNGIAGVLISDSPANQVGPGNLISANGSAVIGAGVWIDGPRSTGNSVVGNKIGTDLAGARALGNIAIGVLVNEAPGNTIGGTASGQTNVISGNTIIGVMLAGAGASGNLVASNLIGTDASGTRPIGNGSGKQGAGLYIENAPNNTVGGPSSAASNVISGNAAEGIELFGAGATRNLIQGNKVGTDRFGGSALGNGNDGIVVNNAPSNQFLTNIVSANAANGFAISGTGATGNLLQGNLIGVGFGGQSLGNGAFGILLANGSSGTVTSGNVNAANALGPVRDTNIAPGSTTVIVTHPGKKKPRKNVQVKARALSFGTRPMATLRGPGHAGTKA